MGGSSELQSSPQAMPVVVKLAGKEMAQCRALADAEVLAQLSNLAYGGEGEVPVGFQDITERNEKLIPIELTNSIIQPTRESSHLRCRVYWAISLLGGYYVIAFAGTANMQDAFEDVAQGGAGVPTDQYRRAHQIGVLVGKAPRSIAIIFTGHSLGGGLAAEAAMVAGRPAVTFNAAGVNQFNIPQHSERATIDAYSTHGDPLTFLQNSRRIIIAGIGSTPFMPAKGLSATMQLLGSLPQAIGHQVVIPDYAGQHDSVWDNFNPLYDFERHKIGRLIQNIHIYEVILKCK